MTLQTHDPAPVARRERSAAIPAAVLDNLAARVRGGGLFLILLGKDGSPAYHDPQAGLFFQRYVLPLLQYGDPTDPELLGRIRKLDAKSPGHGLEQFPRRDPGGFSLRRAPANSPEP